MASARSLPISASLLAATVPTWAISSFLFFTGMDMLLSFSVMSATAFSMPFLSLIGIDAGNHGPQTLVENGFGEDGGGGGAVAGDVAGLGGHLADHAGARVS